jgi:hypothetical protein
MKKLIALSLSLVLAAGCTTPSPLEESGSSDDEPPAVVTAGVPNYPFPTRGNYAVEPMLASNRTEEERHGLMVGLLRDILLNNLIVDSNGPQERDSFRMVLQHSGHIENGIRNITTSETHGYGMMMLAYMAGSEEQLDLSPEQWRNGSENLKDYFDAMLRTVIAFPAASPGSALFTWKLTGRREDVKEEGDGKSYIGEGVNKTAHFTRVSNGNSATDGDMDIIYALMLADRQWGDETKFSGRSYKDIAIKMLEHLWLYCVHIEFYTLQLGDWAWSSHTRPSDFILSHLKAYAEFDPGHDWQKVLDATLGVIKDIRDAENAAGRVNGLLPDFVIRGEGGWEVPPGRVLERNTDNCYSYNSCRVPWRLGTYYLLYGDTPIGDKSLYEYVIKPIELFSFEYSDGEIENFSQARMDGTRIGTNNPSLFAAPFLVTSAAAWRDQDWVDAYYGSWEEWRDGELIENKIGKWNGDHYGDYIQLLALIAANGYWWV